VNDIDDVGGDFVYTFQIRDIPHVFMAHVYRAPFYDNTLLGRAGRMEISYIYEGCVHLECGGEHAEVPRNHIIVLPLLTPTRVYTDQPHCHHTMAFTADLRFCSEGEPGAVTIPPVTDAADAGSSPCRLIDEIIHLHTVSDSPLRCSGLVLQLLGELHERQLRKNAHISAGEAEYVRRAKRYILEHLYQPITQREIAAHLDITPEYLCAVFRKAEKMPMITFINRAKLEGIRALMEKEQLHLYQAAEIYGYTDPNYVSRLYKKLFRRNITETGMHEIHPPLQQ